MEDPIKTTRLFSYFYKGYKPISCFMFWGLGSIALEFRSLATLTINDVRVPLGSSMNNLMQFYVLSFLCILSLILARVDKSIIGAFILEDDS